MDLFDVFPLKVWEEFLDQFENYYDKLIFIKTSSRMELLDLFPDKAAEWHFSAVLKILLGHFYPNNQPTFRSIKKPWHGEGEFESAILNCRRVSKGTKKTVDNFVGDYWEKNCCIAPFAAHFCLTRLKQAEKCLAHADQLKAMKNRPTSPFICGGLLNILSSGGWNDNNENKNCSLSLEKSAQLVSHPNIGQNLRGIHVILCYKADDLQGTCNFVQKLVHSAPNIISLTILFVRSGNQAEGMAVEEAEADIFAQLRHLKHLELCEANHNDGPSLLRDQLEFKQYFEQLTNLEISISLWKEQYNGGLVQFPKLKSLLINKIPLAGSEKNILEIIETRKNAPALRFLIFQSSEFNKAQRMQDYCSIMNCMFFEVQPTLNPNTDEDEEWSMSWSEFKTKLDETIVAVYEFSKVL